MNFRDPNTRTFSYLLKEVLLIKKYVVPISIFMAFFSYALNNSLKDVFSSGVSEHIALFSAFFTLSITLFCYGSTLAINKDNIRLKRITAYFGTVSIYLFSAAISVIIAVSFVHAWFFPFKEAFGLFLVGTSFLSAVIIICFLLSKSLFEEIKLPIWLPINVRMIGVAFVFLGIASMYLSIQQQLEVIAQQVC